jgi:predicted DsbA family dithiol-disulfide isomerase
LFSSDDIERLEENPMDRVKISYFTDALCVWAYVSQVRIDELKASFVDAVELDSRYFQVFGNVANKIDAAWRDRGGLPSYRRHVREIVEKFGHVKLHERSWETDVPKSSMPAHLFLCATRHVESASRCAPGSGNRTAWALREAFFRHGRDISQRKVLLEVVESMGLPAAEIEIAIATGAAHAALAEDLELARTQSMAASPTLLFNEGRQRLTGNVGYRIIEANIRELLEHAPGQQLSWC